MLCCSVAVFIAWKEKSKTLNKAISCATSTRWTSRHVTLCISGIETKIRVQRHQVQPIHIPASFSSDQKKSPKWKPISLSLDALLAARAVVLVPDFRQLWSIHEDKLVAACLPRLWALLEKQGWHPKSSPSLHAPHPCPPLATSLLSGIRIHCWSVRVKDPLLAENRMQGTGSNLKEVRSGCKKDFTQQKLTQQGPERLWTPLLPKCCWSTQWLSRNVYFRSN